MDLQKAFNNHFIEFINDVADYFNDRVEIQTTANALRMIKKTNPRLIINVWHEHIANVYSEQIEAGDIDFFITKNYNDDVSNMSGNDEVLNGIDKIRGPIHNMAKEDQHKSMKYIQNLTKLCHLYYLNRK